MKKLDEVLTVNPYQFQIDGVKYALNHHYCIIGDEMGLGKSLQGIALALITDSKTLVVCPSYLKYNWKKEIEKLSKYKKRIEIAPSMKDIELLSLEADFIIINYEQLKMSERLFVWANLVLVDEVHYLKNPKTTRTKVFTKNLKISPPERFIGLSGTAVQNRVSEFYSILGICGINPNKTSGVDVRSIFKTYYSWCNYFSFKRKYKVNNIELIKFEGLKNLPQLKRVMEKKYIRRLTEEVLDLPDKIHKDVWVDFETEAKELEEAWKAYQEGRTGQKITMAKAQSAYIKAKFTGRYVKDLLDSGVDKVLIFTDHLNPLKVMYEEIALNQSRAIRKISKTKSKEVRESNPSKWSVRIVSGEVPAEKRQEICDGFQNGDINVIIATIGSMSVGWNLTAASNVVFNDLSWVPSNNNQAEKRIHRIGQKSHCTIHRIISSEVDNMIIQTIAQKMLAIEKILN